MKTRSPKRNLILGCATGYTSLQITPFVRSLREAGFEGDLALVIDRDQSEDLASIGERFRVELVPIIRAPKWLPEGIGSRLQNRGRMRLLHLALGKGMPWLLRNRQMLALLAGQLHYFFHIACSRYLIYYGYLFAHPGSYSNVLLADVRDVIFQADPFLYSNGKELLCFMEPGMCLGDEPINTEWVTTTFGQEYCASRTGKPISCSGTTMGDYDSMLNYLQRMCIELLRALPRIPGIHGVDQAIHNFLIWENRLPNLALCENGKQAVMTLKHENLGRFHLDEAGWLYNLDGKPAPILHQHEFHPELVQRIERRMQL